MTTNIKPRYHQSVLESICFNDKLFSLRFAQFLPASSIFNIRCVNRKLYDHVQFWKYNKILLKRIHQGLDKIMALNQMNLAIFLASLVDSDAVVSGSSIQEWINNDSRLKANDVDIYQYYAPDRHFSPIENYLWKTIDQKELNSDYISYANISEIKNIRIYQKNKKILDNINRNKFTVNDEGTYPIQIMNIFNSNRDCTIDQWINNSFDMDFLKSTFDGHRLVICDVQSIRDQTSIYKVEGTNTNQFQDNSLDCRHAKRIFKYLKRGYTFSNLEFKIVLYNEFQLLSLQKKHDSRIGMILWFIKCQDISRALTFELPKLENLQFNVQNIHLDKSRIECYEYNDVEYISIEDLIRVFGSALYNKYFNRSEISYYKTVLQDRFKITNCSFE